MGIVLALICKHEHHRSALHFATELNRALHGNRGYDQDIAPEDVEDLLAKLHRRRKGALRFIERQGAPYRLTRAKTLAFRRELDFDGSLHEWVVGGRRAKVMKQREQRPCSKRQNDRRDRRGNARVGRGRGGGGRRGGDRAPGASSDSVFGTAPELIGKWNSSV
jgi:hypothetical protein